MILQKNGEHMPIKSVGSLKNLVFSLGIEVKPNLKLSNAADTNILPKEPKDLILRSLKLVNQ